MTTGNFTKDLRSTYSGNSGSFQHGIGFKKSWSGSDEIPFNWRGKTIPSYNSVILDEFGSPVVIPKYTKRVFDPRVARSRSPHPYTCLYQSSCTQRYDQYIAGLWRNYVYGATGTTYTPGTGVVYPSDASWTANDSIALTNRLRKRMMGSDFDPALFLCQADQTLGLIFGSARRLDRGIRALKRGQLSQASKIFTQGTSVKAGRHRDFKTRNFTPQDLSSAQLELSYGWLPLLNDAYAGAQYVGHLTQLPQRATYRARYRRAIACTDTLAGLDFDTQKSHVIGQIIAHMEEDYAFSATYMAGLDDPATMIWERLPWSFVADWFIPIQNYLMARGFARQVKGTFETVTGRDITIRGLEVKTGYSGTYRLISDGSKFFYREGNISRSVSTSLAVPYPKPKSLLSVASWRRSLNAVSLLVQRCGSNAALATGANIALGGLAAKVLPDVIANDDALSSLADTLDF